MPCSWRRRRRRAVALRGLQLRRHARAAASLVVRPAARRRPRPITGTVTVFAAASLTEAFTTLGKQFEAAHPGIKVTSTSARARPWPTRSPRAQPADVFASASQKNMDQVHRRRRRSLPTAFAKNSMEIAVAAGQPGQHRLGGRPGQAGRQGRALPGAGAVRQRSPPKVFDNAKITVTPVTEEADVKAVLTKVTLGEVDAGIVYVTDVEGGRRQGQGHRDPGRRQRLDDLPDRRADQGAERRPRPRPSSTTCSRRRGRPCSTAGGFASP